MHLYQSGTPRNDLFQIVENRLCSHRLFSMHGSYEKAIMRWLSDVRDGVTTLESFIDKYPEHRDYAMNGDTTRRIKQQELDDDRDWVMLDVIGAISDSDVFKRKHPSHILLDSGAFTAWNKGDVTEVDEVLRKYSMFLDQAGNLFDEIWMVNLDVIPGEKGRDPTERGTHQMQVRKSDENLEILQKEFGTRNPARVPSR